MSVRALCTRSRDALLHTASPRTLRPALAMREMERVHCARKDIAPASTTQRRAPDAVAGDNATSAFREAAYRPLRQRGAPEAKLVDT